MRVQKMLMPRPEYPRPLLVRSDWKNLNGSWRFVEDVDDIGLVEGWFKEGLPKSATTIQVPFPVESEASTINNIQPASVVWYHREFDLPGDWDKRKCLRFGACDHWTRVFVNGQEVGQHRGGYAPFSFDIDHVVRPGANTIVVRVEDSLSWTQPRGKQAGTTRWPIDYDSVTGIWQTVWLEPLPPVSIESTHSVFEASSGELTFTSLFSKQVEGELTVELLLAGVVVGRKQVNTGLRSEARVSFQLDEPVLWSTESPTLYDVKLTLLDTRSGDVDEVVSYTGLREIGVRDGHLVLNGEKLFLRGVLDQGYFPGGWYTALSDDDIRRDVELTLQMGFNCARKHQKAEDPRYLYWADKLGLLVWAEMPSGKIFSTELVQTLVSEWTDLVKRDRAHPCVMAWVPFNESWGVWHQSSRPQQRAFVDGVVGITRAMDTSRPVIGNDGWEFSSGDLWTLHLYFEQKNLTQRLNELIESPQSSITEDHGTGSRAGALAGANVEGLPILLTECGGVGYGRYSDSDFSYGDLPETEVALQAAIQAIAQMIHAAPKLQGFVWTQFTDVQQEVNGLLYFDRTPKLPIETLHEIIASIG